jgi:hypothetical protein
MLCKCGCNRPAPIATKTSKARGWSKGKSKTFINGHNSKSTIKIPTDKRVGMRTVIDETKGDHINSRKWKMLCDCGDVVWVKVHNALVHPLCRSCANIVIGNLHYNPMLSKEDIQEILINTIRIKKGEKYVKAAGISH